MGTRTIDSVIELMRTVIGRPNQNDPSSTYPVLFSYLNDFVSLTMSDDVKLFEQFGTLSFTIDESNTTGVYIMNELGAEFDFQNLSMECYISLLDPVGSSVSWNFLPIYQDPGEFYSIWGINNEDILIPGYPTNLLYYGNELVFRTIPNTSYLVKIYGYKKNNNYTDDETDIQFDYWKRYLAYGAAKNYAQDFRYQPESIAIIDKGFARERKLMLTHTHNQVKNSRSLPRF